MDENNIRNQIRQNRVEKFLSFFKQKEGKKDEEIPEVVEPKAQTILITTPWSTIKSLSKTENPPTNLIEIALKKKARELNCLLSINSTKLCDDMKKVLSGTLSDQILQIRLFNEDYWLMCPECMKKNEENWQFCAKCGVESINEY